MEHVEKEQILHIMQNLSNLEISYTDYSKHNIDYNKFQTYLDYFNNYVIRSHNLSRFYFAFPLTQDSKIPQHITELSIVPEATSFAPGLDFSVAKLFNFPDAIRHKCEYDTFAYLMSGAGTIQLDNQTMEMKEGDFYLIPQAVYYGITTCPESICVFINIRHSFMVANYKSIFWDDQRLCSFIVSSLDSKPAAECLTIHTANTPAIKDRILGIFTEYINQDKYSNNAISYNLSLLFADILRDDKTEIISENTPEYKDEQYRMICEYIRQNYQFTDLTNTAEHFHFSKQYICKIIKKASGKTFQMLLKEQRLTIVKDYLSDTELPIEMIAELCGFSTAAHLSRTFKETYGMTPTEYRVNGDGST